MIINLTCSDPQPTPEVHSTTPAVSTGNSVLVVVLASFTLQELNSTTLARFAHAMALAAGVQDKQVCKGKYRMRLEL